jgi:ketosteroid isomerase-like protein
MTDWYDCREKRNIKCKCDCRTRCCRFDPFSDLCEDVADLLRDFNEATNTKNVTRLSNLMSSGVTLNVYFENTPAVVGNAAVIERFSDFFFSQTSTFIHNITEAVVESDDKYIVFGNFQFTRTCATPTTFAPIPSVIRFTVGCSNGRPRITRIEIWADLNTIVDPC